MPGAPSLPGAGLQDCRGRGPAGAGKGAPRPRGLRRCCLALGVGVGTGGAAGKVGASGSWVPPAWAGAGPGDRGHLLAASVSQCGCLNGEVAVRAFDGPTAGLSLYRAAPTPSPTPAVPTGILFGGVLAAREHLLPGSTLR